MLLPVEEKRKAAKIVKTSKVVVVNNYLKHAQ